MDICALYLCFQASSHLGIQVLFKLTKGGHCFDHITNIIAISHRHQAWQHIFSTVAWSLFNKYKSDDKSAEVTTTWRRILEKCVCRVGGGGEENAAHWSLSYSNKPSVINESAEWQYSRNKTCYLHHVSKSSAGSVADIQLEALDPARETAMTGLMADSILL